MRRRDQAPLQALVPFARLRWTCFATRLICQTHPPIATSPTALGPCCARRGNWRTLSWLALLGAFLPHTEPGTRTAKHEGLFCLPASDLALRLAQQAGTLLVTMP